MSEIRFAGDDEAAELMRTTIEKNKDKGFIVDPDGFIKHHRDTKRIGHDFATKILDNHPYYNEDVINPNVIDTLSLFHDYTKIIEGGKYHEIGTAHIILTRGNIPIEHGGLGLISGGSEKRQNNILKRMSSSILTDFLSYEELGGNNYPDGALYKEIENFYDRVEYLRKNLSETDKPLTIGELTIPKTIEQKIALVADFSNLNGERVSVIERLNELVERYNKEGKFYNPQSAKLADTTFRPRLIAAAEEIGQLYGESLL